MQTLKASATELPAVGRGALQARVDQILNRHAAVGLAVGVVRHDSLEFFAGHGFADIASKTPISEDTVFRIASITKTLTAIAVMQLCERGLIELDEPANSYLGSYSLVPAKPSFRPATVRHLLTHTAGVGEELRFTDAFKPLFGEIVPEGRLTSLAEYYRGALPLGAEPGTRFVYTDHGFATLGQIVEDVSGEPFPQYVREHIFEPLGMTHSDLVRSDRVRSRLATGYTLGSRGAKAVAGYEIITVGGGAAYSSPRDMARYLAALMGGGANEHGRVLEPATLATMFEPQYRPDPRVPGIGLAFSRFDFGGHPVVEHQGVLPGFNSQIFVAPEDGIGVMVFTNGARQAMLWLPGETSGLLSYLLGLPDEGIRSDVPQHPEIWRELTGWYQVDAQWSDQRLRMMLGAGVEVRARGDRLILRLLTPIPAAYRGFELHPDDPSDPYVFGVDASEFGIGKLRVVFGQQDGVVAIHPEIMPLTLRKQAEWRNPRRWATAALVAAGAAVAAGRLQRRAGRPS